MRGIDGDRRWRWWAGAYGEGVWKVKALRTYRHVFDVSDSARVGLPLAQVFVEGGRAIEHALKEEAENTQRKEVASQ